MRTRIIPVVDVMNGVAVHAAGGRRDAYRPLGDVFGGSSDPVMVARDLVNRTSATQIYLADLDAIRTGVRGVSDDILAKIPAEVLLDAGGLFQCDVPNVRLIEPFETATTPQGAGKRLRDHCGRPPVFSIDLRAGQLVGPWEAWSLRASTDALGLARRAVAIGYRNVIVLDVAHVGGGTGGGTFAICEAVRREFPGVNIISGGGVRTWDDVDAFGRAGVDGVLAATAIYTGTLTFPRPAS